MNHYLIKILIIFLLVCVFEQMNGQGVQIIEEPAVAEMMDNFLLINEANSEIRGYRLQILVTTNRRLMEKTKRNFESKYPEYNIEWSYSEPFYKLKVGAYLSQLEALPLLRRFQKEYPGTHTTLDNIEIAELINEFK